ncbi:transposase [Nitrospirillum amazonense]|uniref:transposase n=1 Tax=Nitrospirillum amazonense TaxID=28077 RepID=UPI0011A2EC0A
MEPIPVSSNPAAAHLEEISRQVQPSHHAIVILDGAGWHKKGGTLKVPANISLLALPPYCPELNPVENVWQFLRQNWLAHTVFSAYTDILDACCRAWNNMANQPGRIRSIAQRTWAKVNY